MCWFVFTYQNVLAEFPTSFFYAHFGLVKFYLMFLKLSFQDFFLKTTFWLVFLCNFLSNFSTIIIQKLEGPAAQENSKSLEEDMWTDRP